MAIVVKVLHGHQNEVFGFDGPRQVRGVDTSAPKGFGLGRLRKFNRKPRRAGYRGGHSRGWQMSRAENRATHNSEARMVRIAKARAARKAAREALAQA